MVAGTNDRYVYSCQVNRRIKAGVSMPSLDIGEALAENWLPEMHTAIFASATMTVSGSFDHFTHAVG
ncbi:MAG: hypothetical protein ACLVKA_01555 [Collinsella aerofaciens]